MSETRRIHDIQPFHVMALLARARQLEAEGRDIVHMEIGEPDFPSPPQVVAAGLDAIKDGEVHYTPASGLPVLRQAIADFYAQHYAVTVSADRIIVTPGASGALLLTLGVLLERDQAVLMADPGYPCNRNFVRFLEGRTTAVNVGAESGYQLTAEQVKHHWQAETRAVLLASPSNPTGTLIDPDTMQGIIRQTQQLGGAVIVDEIYHGLVYGGQAKTALALSDEVFVINSFSKYFGMTGWRLGWVVAPEAYVESLDKLAQNLFLAAPTPAQYAALAAFQPETIAVLEQRREAFQQRRDFLLPALRQLGFKIPVEPQGAFYLYADCSAFTDDSYAFAEELLEQAGVAITPGKDFGHNQPEKHLRFAYTTSMERLQEGVARLGKYLGKS
ncbi:MAG: pyridoxal phosphate-dependent aminotransferase [Gammaproteobacteria bacterium]|nr:pyridoxal phosphate-dependent aminotransferase [Gammaproteobacteria bacterium]MDH5653020.1 pyridoxal phosphate-dependent aminotransferase [Gammaproteobacteria bacterium]